MIFMFKQYKCIINIALVEHRTERYRTISKPHSFMVAHKNIGETAPQEKPHSYTIYLFVQFWIEHTHKKRIFNTKFQKLFEKISR